MIVVVLHGVFLQMAQVFTFVGDKQDDLWDCKMGIRVIHMDDFL